MPKVERSPRVAILISLVALLAVFAVSGFSGILDFGKLSLGMMGKNEEQMAYDAVREKTFEVLKAPSTAKWPSMTSEMVTKFGENQYEVTTYVDAENSYGAMLRATVQAEVWMDSSSGQKQARITKFSFDGEKF